jgi:hypothetical protein|tara:strand:- start:1394 stop:1705 length:312 start_codon:yes stop_codon:yes gene_type:complete
MSKEMNQYQNDLEMLDVSMHNAYRVLTNKISIKRLINSSDDQGMWLPYADIFNPSNKDIDSVIEYYCDLEEYEKCAELVKIKEYRKTQAKIDRINNSKLGGIK